jgi:hypothetical protein
MVMHRQRKFSQLVIGSSADAGGKIASISRRLVVS